MNAFHAVRTQKNVGNFTAILQTKLDVKNDYSKSDCWE